MRSFGSKSDGARPAEQCVLQVLEGNLSPIMARCVLQFALSVLHVDLEHLTPDDVPGLMKELERGVRLYAPDAATRCGKQLLAVVEGLASGKDRSAFGAARALAGGESEPNQANSAVCIPITCESDIVRARHAGREICSRLGFTRAEEVKAATVISELARNIVLYARKGEVTLSTWSDGGRVGIEIRAKDHGPGIPHLDAVLSGKYQSRTGLGLGIVGARKLAHAFEISSNVGKGTDIVARMALR